VNWKQGDFAPIRKFEVIEATGFSSFSNRGFVIRKMGRVTLWRKISRLASRWSESRVPSPNKFTMSRDRENHGAQHGKKKCGVQEHAAVDVRDLGRRRTKGEENG